MAKNVETVSISIPKDVMKKIEEEYRYELEKTLKSKKVDIKEISKNMNKSKFIVKLIKLGLRAKREGLFLE